jgi:phosphomannomutase
MSVQIIPPHDKGIESTILNNLSPWENSWDTSILATNNQLSDPLQEAKHFYMKTLGQDVLQHNLNRDCHINFTYTAMHGVGYLYMEEAFRTVKFKVHISNIKSFPTVFAITFSSVAYMLIMYVTKELNPSQICTQGLSYQDFFYFHFKNFG